MPYLAAVRINPARSAGRGLLASPHAVHHMVRQGLPDTALTERTLWRWDYPDDTTFRPRLLILTQSKPDWTHVVEAAGWPDADGDHSTVRDYTPLLDRVARGREFAFRLIADPARTRSTGWQTRQDPRRRNRIRCRTDQERVQWLTDRSAAAGFSIPTARTEQSAPGLVTTAQSQQIHDVAITKDTLVTFRGPGSPDRPKLAIHYITFEGRLIVTNPDQFRHGLLNGIGPSKAYGCGLLTLAPLAHDR